MVEAAVTAVVSLKVRQDDLALPRVEAVDEGQEFVRDRVRHAADLSELLVDHLPDVTAPTRFIRIEEDL